MSGPPYRPFLGLWTLIPQSCRYEQGDPPAAGQYRIDESQPGVLSFVAQWTDAEGREHQVEFSGPADGTKIPFAGTELADALSIEAVSARELNSYAFFEGKELMVAQRQLDESGEAMRITQVVRLPDGTRPANVAIYRRAPKS